MAAPTSGDSRRVRGVRAARWRRGFFGLGSETVPSRSIFGARLRSRVPQYGHSVMYGLTSCPQFLHTTKRSGELAIRLPMIGPARAGVGHRPACGPAAQKSPPPKSPPPPPKSPPPRSPPPPTSPPPKSPPPPPPQSPPSPKAGESNIEPSRNPPSRPVPKPPNAPP